MTVVKKSCIRVFLKILASRFSSRIFPGLQLFDKVGNESVFDPWKPHQFHWKPGAVSDLLNIKPGRSAYAGSGKIKKCLPAAKVFASRHYLKRFEIFFGLWRRFENDC